MVESRTAIWKRASCVAMPTSPSARPARPELGTKVELKNLNSISFVRDGIAHEIKRQIAVVESGGTIVQKRATTTARPARRSRSVPRRWRSDYRYFPDPDLMPVKVDERGKAGSAPGAPTLPFDKQSPFFAEVPSCPNTITAVAHAGSRLCATT